MPCVDSTLGMLQNKSREGRRLIGTGTFTSMSFWRNTNGIGDWSQRSSISAISHSTCFAAREQNQS
jgi:hypothetical protein